MRYLLSLLLLLLLASVSTADDDERLSWGPFMSRSTGVINIHGLRTTPMRVDVLEQDQVQIDMSLAYGNIWHPGRNVFLDYEFSRTSIRAFLGIGNGMEIGLEVGGYTHFGGFLDGGIEAFHKIIGFIAVQRDKYPRNQSFMKWGDRTFAGLGNQIQDISLYHKQRFTSEDSAIVITGGLAGKIAIAPFLYSTTQHDVGLWLGSRIPVFDALQLFASSSVTFMGQGGKDFIGMKVALAQWSLFGGIGVKLSGGLTFFSQILIVSPASSDTQSGLLQENTYEITTGLRVAFENISGPGFIEMGLTEDVYIYGNASDITFVVNMVFRY